MALNSNIKIDLVNISVHVTPINLKWHWIVVIKTPFKFTLKCVASGSRR